MQHRLFTNWTPTRLLYLIIGGALAISSAMDGAWAGIVIGGYFAVMGLFAIGCAGGACNPQVPDAKYSEKLEEIEDVEFEEVKP